MWIVGVGGSSIGVGFVVADNSLWQTNRCHDDMCRLKMRRGGRLYVMDEGGAAICAGQKFWSHSPD